MSTVKNESVNVGSWDPGIPPLPRKDKRVTSNKCIAIVLSKNSSNETDYNVENFNHETQIIGKDVFDDLILRNKTCYWNPALVESVKALKYKGFMHPNTLLIGGEQQHLENLRTAWGRRVINHPANYIIETIGDLCPIQMEVIPQTNFVPLPEALCRIIMDLNNAQVTATLDVIRDRLTHYYGKDTHQPTDQLIYDTLGKLIRERKAFHTGSGYFVVTPDTYRLRSDDITQTYSTNVSYHPMYVPPQNRIPMKSISCQANIMHPPIYDCPKPPVSRSNSTRVSSVSRGNKGASQSAGSEASEKEFKQIEAQKKVSSQKSVTTKSTKPLKTKTSKPSFLSRLFTRARRKKKIETLQENQPEIKYVEYATFSGQFPPPEWKWYQQKQEKQKRVEDWVTLQTAIPKSQTWHKIASQESHVSSADQSAYSRTSRRSRSLPRRSKHPPIVSTSVAKNQLSTIYDNLDSPPRVQQDLMTIATPSTIHPGDGSFLPPFTPGARYNPWPRHSSPIVSEDEISNEDGRPESLAPLRIINNDLTVGNKQHGRHHRSNSSSHYERRRRRSNISRKYPNEIGSQEHSQIRWHSHESIERFHGEISPKPRDTVNENFSQWAHRVRRQRMQIGSSFVPVNSSDISHEYAGSRRSRRGARRLLSRSQDSGVNCIVGPNVSYATTENSPPVATCADGHNCEKVHSLSKNSQSPSGLKYKSHSVPFSEIGVCERHLSDDGLKKQPPKLTTTLDNQQHTGSERSCETVIKRDTCKNMAAGGHSKVKEGGGDSGFFSNAHCDQKQGNVGNSDNKFIDEIKNCREIWRTAEQRLSKEINTANDHNIQPSDDKNAILNNQRPIRSSSSSAINDSDSKDNMEQKLMLATRKFNMNGDFQVVGVL